MNARECEESIPAQTLTAYWLGELGDLAESEIEEHLFSCAKCTERLYALARIGEGIKKVTRAGNVRAILTAPFIERLQTLGMRVREYRVHAGGSVMCTITPEDDMVVAHLHAPLLGTQRLDLLVHDVTDDTRVRIEDVAFDPSADEVVMLSNTAHLRQLGVVTLQVQLLAVDRERERVLGEYTFNHSPHG